MHNINTMTLSLSRKILAIPGPGQMPVMPQPSPKIDEPMIKDLSVFDGGALGIS